MQVAIPQDATSVKLSYDAGDEPADQAYLAFSRANSNLRVEHNANGEILVVPPGGSESSYRKASVTAPLFNCGFLHLCPEFVIEVLSPTDRLQLAKAEMEQWIANEAQLAWLLDGDAETAYVYRRNHAVKKHRGVAQLAGEDPIDGFILKLDAICTGVR
jgi:Uma2 family endonuclease